MRIRKTKAVLLSLLTFLLLPSIVQQVSTSVASTPVPTLYVNPPAQSGNLGTVFTIDIDIAHVQDIIGFDLKLGYNTMALDALDAVTGQLVSPPFMEQIEINETEGYVWFYVMCWPADGNGTLATITFNATCADCAICILDLYDTVLEDLTGPINHDVCDGCFVAAPMIPEFPATIFAPLLMILAIVAAFLGRMVWSRKRRGPSTA